MRIISGRFKGRRLKVSSKKISPTKDRVKVIIFDILADRVKGAKVLDLFSGTGALGFEALSRGAKEIFAVDKDITNIKKNLKSLSISAEDNMEVYKRDVFSFLRWASRKKMIFSLIFLDPPYHRAIMKKCLQELNRYDILAHNGLLIAEHETKTKLPQRLGIFEVIKTHKAGQTSISFFRKIKMEQ